MAKFSPLYAMLIAATSLSLAAPSQAQSSTQTCQAFGNFGGILTRHILPLSVKDFADMNSGKNPRLVQVAVAKLEQGLTASDKQAISRLGEENGALFEEAASDLAMNIVLTGSASTSQATAAIMRQECQNLGVSQIIEIQRATYQSQGQSQPQGQIQGRTR